MEVIWFVCGLFLRKLELRVIRDRGFVFMSVCTCVYVCVCLYIYSMFICLSCSVRVCRFGSLGVLSFCCLYGT